MTGTAESSHLGRNAMSDRGITYVGTKGSRVALGQPGDPGPRLPKETSGGGGKGTGKKPGKGGPKLPKEGLA